MEVRARLTSTAQRYSDGTSKTGSYPNNFYGWGVLDASKAVGNLGGGSAPTQFVLRNNFPNPFNGSTTIVVDAPGEQSIELAIYDVLGRRVRTIYRGTSTKGSTPHQWRDALNDNGIQVATGIYLCRLTAPGTVSSQKILYIK
jgi:hypothetical protein